MTSKPLRVGATLAIALLAGIMARANDLPTFYPPPNAASAAAPDAGPGDGGAMADPSACAAGCGDGGAADCGDGGGQDCNRVEAYLFASTESFRGITNGSYPDNHGATGGVNSGFALPGLSEYGIGGQLGGSYGVSEASGKVSPGSEVSAAETQIFVTMGVFRRADENNPWSAGLAYDFMVGDNFGEFGSSLTLSQWRLQLGYDLNECNEVGLWGTVHDRDRLSPTGALSTPLEYRAMDQLDFFWRHKYCARGADSTFYAGLPAEDRLTQGANGFPVGGTGGRLGSVIVGMNWNVPVADRLALVANGMYMFPSQSAGANGSGAFAAAQEFWSLSVGLNIYLGGSRSQTTTVAGNPFMPLMPVANNGTFMVDANKTE